MVLMFNIGRYGFFLAIHAYSGVYDKRETRLTVWRGKWKKTVGTSARELHRDERGWV